MRRARADLTTPLSSTVNSRARLTEDLNATRAQGRAYTTGIGSALDQSGGLARENSDKNARPHIHRSASMRSYNNRNNYGQDSLPIQVTM